MSQAALAEWVGVSTEFISRLERGKAYPSIPTLMRLCRSLRCTPNDLLLEDETPAESVARLETRLRLADPEARERAVWVAEAVLDYAKNVPGR